MGADKNSTDQKVSLFVTSSDFFKESVRQACSERKIETYPQVESYIVNLLEYYLDARNLFDTESVDETGNRKPKTLAELYLIAHNSETATKVELLKKLADRSLYMSGFFGDSFERKIIDVDYYADMGGSAYRTLSEYTKEDTLSTVYRTISTDFIRFMDVLALISQNSLVQSNQSVLRLYDRYMRTGSDVAREKLVQMGVLTIPFDQVKLTKHS